MYPWDPRKVIRSSQVVHTKTTTQKSPPNTLSRKRKALDSLEIITPYNKRQLDASFASISESISVSRDVRVLIQKTGKTLDRLAVQTAQQKLQNDAQTVRLEQLLHKKQKKAAVDSNETFANIEKIKRAQEAVAEQEEAWRRKNTEKDARAMSNQLLMRSMQDFMFTFQIDAVGGEQNAGGEGAGEA